MVKRKEKGEEEYELIPISPLRKLEKRLEKIESSGSGISGGDFFKELVSIVRMNQQLVDELAKANDALRIELAKLPPKLDNLVEDLSELISFIKASAAEEAAGGAAPETLKPLLKKMDQLIEGNKKIVESYEMLVETVEKLEGKMRRPPRPFRKRTSLIPLKPPE